MFAKLTLSGECRAEAYALKCGSGWICCYSCPLPSPFIPYPTFSRRSSMSIDHMGNREGGDNTYRSTTLHAPSKYENQSFASPHKTLPIMQTPGIGQPPANRPKSLNPRLKVRSCTIEISHSVCLQRCFAFSFCMYRSTTSHGWCQRGQYSHYSLRCVNTLHTNREHIA